MDVNIGAMLIRIIEQYRATHPEEAAEADRQYRNLKPFSGVEPEIFSSPALNENTQKGEK